MNGLAFEIDADIRRARTLPAAFYRDAALFDESRKRLFARSWQFVGDSDLVKVPGQVQPLTFLPGFLDEPLLLTRDTGDRVRCLPNVCTHRGNLLIEGACRPQTLRCRYHGRRFGLDGSFLSMPGFDGVEGFPGPEESLTPAPSGGWGKFLFASIEPAHSLEALLAPMRERLAGYPLDRLTLDAPRSRDYLVRAHWALYCDNYLEGFHIPFVHPDLARALDVGKYATELFELGTLQIGLAASGEETLDLAPESPDSGKPVAAYYFWLFPNTMFNVYPWGISVNVITPLAIDRTRVSFLSYVADPSRLERGAGAALDRVEREDEAIVESVQTGVRSSFYKRGRYSPEHERGVHLFHRLLADTLAPTRG